MPVLWTILGATVAAPLAVAIALWLNRRTWKSTRRLARRARDHEHLVEVSQLVGGLAHEIKNPLSTINLNLRLLTEDLQHYTDEDHQRWLRRLKGVGDEVERLRSILTDFLHFAGKVELQLRTVDLSEVLDDLLDFFSPQADATRVVLRPTLPEGPVPCRIDVNLIKQAVLNLMINAVQAMPDGGELIVRLSAWRQRAVLEIIDTGPGIDPEVLGKVFQVYFSTKKDGTGLGLPTSRRIIREHGGEIDVDSQPGRGTQFTIRLPLAAPTELSATSEEQA